MPSSPEEIDRERPDLDVSRLARPTLRAPGASQVPVPWIALAILVIVGVGLLGVRGPGTPDGTSTPDGAGGGDEVSATTSGGPFSLTIRAEHSRYAPTDEIRIDASLVYTGPDPEIAISHGYRTPLGFGIVEPVLGLELAPSWRLTCERSILERDVPITRPFGKSGGFDDLDPRAAEKRHFLTDPILRLPPGTWHVYAVASFEIGDCGADQQQIRAEITIVVPAADGSIPTAVPPTATPDPGDLPVGADTQEGPIQLTLSSPHREYREGEAIDVIAGLGYWGDEPSVTTYGSSSLGPVAFWLRQLDGDVQTGSAGTADCVSQSVLRANEPIELPFSKAALSVTGARGDFWQGWQGDPDLLLPPGTWEIAATTEFSLAWDCSVPGPVLRPSITVVVLP